MKMMNRFKSPFWEALGVFGGMIIGSGMFALPYAVSVSGMWASLLGIVFAFFAVLSIHLIYGEIVLNTEGKHRLPGYAKLHLGQWAGNFNKITQVIFFNVTLLIYGVLGGIFLAMIFGWEPFWWTLMFFGASAIILFFENIETIGLINLALTVPLIIAILLISFASLANGSLSNLPTVGKDPFFAFGIFVFALAGLSVIPDAREVFKRKEDEPKLKSVITLGTSIPLILYVLFVVAVLMAVNGAISEDAISSLYGVLGEKVVLLGAIMGFLAVLTSFLVLAYDLKAIYEFDIGAPRYISYFFAVSAPALLFVAGLEDFVKLISVVGGIFIALDSFFVIFILRKIRQSGLANVSFLKFGFWHQLALILIFAASIVYEVIYQVL